MKVKFKFTILVLTAIVFMSMNSIAGTDFEKAMLKAKKNLKTALDKNDMSLLTKSRGEFERILQLKKDTWLVNYYIALTDYGMSMNGSANQKTDVIKKYTESGIEVINKSLDENPEFADSYVLLEALNFNRWQYEQEKMSDIISATNSADESAKKLEPNNPRYLLITGIAHYWTPEQFGGGVSVCIPEFEKSISLFKTRKEASNLYPDWGQDLALGYLALSLIKRDDDGDLKKAKEYIDEAIKLSPESGFISEYVMEEYNKSSKKN